MYGWQANKKTHLCVASNIRVIPENEKPPAMRVDIYFGVEKRMGVILSHWGFCKNPEGEESLFTACLTKNGIYDKLEKRQ